MKRQSCDGGVVLTNAFSVVERQLVRLSALEGQRAGQLGPPQPQQRAIARLTSICESPARRVRLLGKPLYSVRIGTVVGDASDRGQSIACGPRNGSI